MTIQQPYTEIVFNWDSDHSQSFSNASTPEPQMTNSPYFEAEKASCSAFSMWAKPTEDWTKIQDADERRRVQNRIAQRYYRKKMKQKLDYLEENWRMSLSLPSPPRRPRSRLSDPGYGARRSHARTNSSQSLHDDYNQFPFSRQLDFAVTASNPIPASIGSGVPCAAPLLDLSTGFCPSGALPTTPPLPGAPIASQGDLAGDYMGFPDPWLQLGPQPVSLNEAVPARTVSFEGEPGHFGNAGTNDAYGHYQYPPFPGQCHPHLYQTNASEYRPRSMPPQPPQMHSYPEYLVGGSPQ